MTTEERPLTDKQERFIHEYCIDHNARQAALRAGYSASTCGAQASALMRDVRVKRRIRENLRDLFTRLNISAERLLRERAAVAFFDPASLIDAQGQPVPLHEIDPEVRSALAISYQQKGEVLILRVRNLNRNPALAVLEKRVAELRELDREEEEELARQEQVAAFEERMEENRRRVAQQVRKERPQEETRTGREAEIREVPVRRELARDEVLWREAMPPQAAPGMATGYVTSGPPATDRAERLRWLAQNRPFAET